MTIELLIFVIISIYGMGAIGILLLVEPSTIKELPQRRFGVQFGVQYEHEKVEDQMSGSNELINTIIENERGNYE